jgi:hypothetical protein
MNRDSVYYRQVQLLIRLLPLVAEEDCFVLKGEFRGMIEHPVSLGELETTRTVLIEKINAELTDPERRFLLSFKNKAPD